MGDTRGSCKTTPHPSVSVSLSHFHISCAGDAKREKMSKNTDTILQTASSARISPSQAIMLLWQGPMSCMMEISHNSVQRFQQSVQSSPWGQTERSHIQTTPRLARRVFYAPALHPPSHLLQARLWSSHLGELRIASLLVSCSPRFSFFNHGAVHYNRRECDFLLYLGDKRKSVMVKINAAPYLSTA